MFIFIQNKNCGRLSEGLMETFHFGSFQGFYFLFLFLTGLPNIFLLYSFLTKNPEGRLLLFTSFLFLFLC